jgi:hypothetical protein
LGSSSRPTAISREVHAHMTAINLDALEDEAVADELWSAFKKRMREHASGADLVQLAIDYGDCSPEVQEGIDAALEATCGSSLLQLLGELEGRDELELDDDEEDDD